MDVIIHLEKKLLSEPQTFNLTGVSVVPVDSPAQQSCWLEVHNAVFGPLAGRPRPWTAADLARELTPRPGSPPPQAWLAVESVAPDSLAPHGTALGAVALGPWAPAPQHTAAIGWLAVLPAARRRGIANLLLATLERAAWQSGRARIIAETRSDWAAALACYEHMGYRPIG